MTNQVQIDEKKQEVFDCMMAETKAGLEQFNRANSKNALADLTFEKICELVELIGEDEASAFEAAIEDQDHELFDEWCEKIADECGFCGHQQTNGWLLKHEECSNEACISHSMTNPYGI